MKKRITCALLALTMIFSLTAPALAAEDSFEGEAPVSPIEGPRQPGGGIS